MITAFQGKIQFADVNQLKLYISKLVTVDNIALLVGSGASVSAGGMTMGELLGFFKSNYGNSYQWLKSENIIPSFSEESDEFRNAGKIVGEVIDELTGILDTKDTLFIGKLDKVKEAREDLVRAIIYAAFLSNQLWKQTPEERGNSENLKYHIRLLQKLKNIRGPRQPSPWIFTSNYDLAIEWSADSIGMTINDGFFQFKGGPHSPQIFDSSFISSFVNSDGNDNTNHLNLIKFQGSLTWEIKNNELIQLQDEMTHTKLMRSIGGMSSLPELLILPGNSMYAKMAQSPHKELLKYFEGFLEKPEPVLFIVGFGFNDSHVNQHILSALSKNSDLRILIYFPEFESLSNINALPEDLIKILNRGRENVTIIGGGSDAYFDMFVEHLPESR